MNPELIGLYIGLGLTLIGMIAGLVNERIRTATSMALMDQAIKVLRKIMKIIRNGIKASMPSFTNRATICPMF